MKKIIIATCLLTTGAFSAIAFEGNRGQNQLPAPPSAEEIAAHVVVDFDVDSSLGLNVTELTEALSFLHENRPPPPPRRQRNDPEEDRPERPAPDFNVMAADLLQTFDTDADSQLSETELIAALEELNKRHRPPHPGQGERPGR